MTSSNGNFFRVTSPLCGEFTDRRWVPRKKASDAELWWFFYVLLNKQLSKHWWGWWFETPSLWDAHYDVTIKPVAHRGRETLLHALILQWSHNGRDRVSNHRHLDCLLTRLIRRRSKKAPKLGATGRATCPLWGEFPGECWIPFTIHEDECIYDHGCVWFLRFRLLTTMLHAANVWARSWKQKARAIFIVIRLHMACKRYR